MGTLTTKAGQFLAKGSDRTWLRAADGTRDGGDLQSWSAPSLLEWGGSFIDLIDLVRLPSNPGRFME